MKPIFVIYCNRPTTPEQREAIKAENKDVAHDYHIVVLPEDLKADVLNGDFFNDIEEDLTGMN